jgi:hypothetical protein
MNTDSRRPVPPRVRIALRFFVTAIHFFVIAVFAVPCAWSAISGSDFPPPIHSWRSWVVWGGGALVVAGVAEVGRHLLTRGRETR